MSKNISLSTSSRSKKRQESLETETSEKGFGIDDLQSENVSTELRTYKVLMVGDDGVGKSCLANQFVNGSFKEGDDLANCLAKNYVVDNEEILLKIWDFDGKERNSMLSKSYYEGSNAVIVMFDVSERTSFEGVKGWLKDIKYYAPRHAIRYLVGNKTDLAANRIVSTQESQALAEKEGFYYLETSAKMRSNIETLFSQLSQKLIQTHFDVGKPEKSKPVHTSTPKPLQSSKCCIIM